MPDAPNGQTRAIYEVVTFELGEMPDGVIGMLLAYATSQEKLSRGELESYVVGMTRDKARELAAALIELANKPPSGKKPATVN